MKEKIIISENTYIEYQKEDDGHIIISSLNIIHDGSIHSMTKNEYHRGILACLIEHHGTEEELSQETIVRSSWPPNAKPSRDYPFESALADRMSKLRKAFGEIIGKEKAKILIPNKNIHGYYKICIADHQIISETINQTPASNISGSSITMKTPFDFDREGINRIDVCQKIVNNDKILFDLDKISTNEEEFLKIEGSPEKWKNFMDEHPTGWAFMVEGQDDIIGNYSSIILSPMQRESLLAGNLYDGLIDLDDTLPFRKGENLTLYILNISVNVNKNTPENNKLLYDHFFSHLIKLAKDNHIYFSEIYFTSWKYRSLLKSYGFREILAKADQSIIMGIEHFPEDLNWERKDELIQEYKKRNVEK